VGAVIVKEPSAAVAAPDFGEPFGADCWHPDDRGCAFVVRNLTSEIVFVWEKAALCEKYTNKSSVKLTI
jgi:hypothetical protein